MPSIDLTAKNLFRTEGFGAATLWVDLANSELRNGFGAAKDLLDDPAWLRAFLTRWDFPLPKKETAPIAQLRRLRGLLRTLVEKTGKTAELRGPDIEGADYGASILPERSHSDVRGALNECSGIEQGYSLAGCSGLRTEE